MQNKDRSTSLIAICLYAINAMIFSNINNFLTIFDTLPVTISTAFSTLQLLKTSQRNNMEKQRLIGLDLMYPLTSTYLAVHVLNKFGHPPSKAEKERGKKISPWQSKKV